jgi:hypothetical protein
VGAAPTPVPPLLSSGGAEDESRAFSLLLIGTFGVSALLLCLAAIPPAWNRPFGLSVRLAHVRGALAVVGLFILLDSAVLALLLAI